MPHISPFSFFFCSANCAIVSPRFSAATLFFAAYSLASFSE
jgi:hypothetical protein